MLKLDKLTTKQGFNGVSLHVELEELPCPILFEDNEELQIIADKFNDLKDKVETLENMDLMQLPSMNETLKDILVDEGYDNIFVISDTIDELDIDYMIELLSDIDEDDTIFSNIQMECRSFVKRYNSYRDQIDSIVKDYEQKVKKLFYNPNALKLIKNIHVYMYWDIEKSKYVFQSSSVCDKFPTDSCIAQKVEYSDVFPVLAKSAEQVVSSMTKISKTYIEKFLQPLHK